MPLVHLPLFLRTLRKDIEVYCLKVGTLSVGFACALVLILFCWHEFTYDQFPTNPEQVFRVLQKNETFDFEGNRFTDRIPENIYNEIKHSSPSIVVSKCKVLDGLSVPAENKTSDVVVHAVDTTISGIFFLKILEGSIKKFQSDSNAIVLSYAHAIRYFGSSACVGKKLKITNGDHAITLVVSAVFEDFPINTHEPFNLFIRFNRALLFNLGFDADDSGLYGRAPSREMMPVLEQTLNASTVKTAPEIVYQFQPITSIYFGRRVVGESARHGDGYSILILICIGSLIFLLGLTNFINLTTLTLPGRSKELAIKKVAGGSRGSLLAGLAAESAAVVVTAFIGALIILIGTRQIIQPVLPVNITMEMVTGKGILIVAFGLILITVFSPLLIALRYVGATPNRLLSSEMITFPKFKKVVTVLQLGLSLSLIVASIVVKRQIVYSLVKEPGRNKDQVVYISYPRGLTDTKRNIFRNEWRQNPNIEGMTAVSHMPDQITSRNISSSFYHLGCERNFLEFFRYKMISGRWFGPNDTAHVVVNRRGLNGRSKPDGHVAGVITDLGAPYNIPEKPIEISPEKYPHFNFLCIRVIEVDVRETVSYIGEHFSLPVTDVKFIDSKFEQWLIYEDKLGVFCGMLAGVSVLMAGLATYGLSLSLGNEKLKQIAIHKMFGASLSGIIKVLMRSFAMSFVLAAQIAGLLTYLLLKEWLRNFIYQTHFGWSEFITAIATCVAIIFITCLRQAVKLLKADLVVCLK